MSTRVKTATLGVVAGMLLASGAYAGPITLSAAQLDAVAAGGVEKTDGFVCPVFNSDAVGITNNPNAVAIAGGDYTIIGPSVSVPTGATNDDGAGSPGGAHVGPGSSTYTAIWAGG